MRDYLSFHDFKIHTKIYLNVFKMPFHYKKWCNSWHKNVKMMSFLMLQHCGTATSCWILDTFRMKQTQMYVCTLVEFILVEIWIHCCTSWRWRSEWIHWLLYNRNNGREMWELLLGANWQKRTGRITMTWETVTLSELPCEVSFHCLLRT